MRKNSLMELLDGKATAKRYRESIKGEVQAMAERGERPPHLVAVLVGNDPASDTYVQNKVRACEKVGIQSTKLQYTSDMLESDLLEKIDELNHDDTVDGFIVQLPLPLHINKYKVIERIDFRKDVDGFHPINIGRMAKDMPAFLPATPNGILKLLEHYQIPTKGKHCVVVGRSDIVGKPISMLMGRWGYPGDCTVTLTHKYTEGLASYTRQADIVITAVGQPSLITGDMLKNGAVGIDVGITRVNDETRERGYVLKGDIDYEQGKERCSYLTPVPGGVGPMTIASLLQNTLLAAKGEVFHEDH